MTATSERLFTPSVLAAVAISHRRPMVQDRVAVSRLSLSMREFDGRLQSGLERSLCSNGRSALKRL